MALMLSFSHLLDEARHLLLDLLEPGLGVGGLGGVHLVHGDDELLHTQGVGEQSVLPRDNFMNSSSVSVQGYFNRVCSSFFSGVKG